MKLKPTERFTSRVDAYVKYRPSYPKALIDYLQTETGLTSQDIIADIGSGTGLLTKLFLDNGNKVYGVEPNKSMREAAENLLKEYKNFISVSGTAEATNLESGSVNLITAGQSFHWFEPIAAKQEFKRIAADRCKIFLIWNDRDIENDPLQKEYEAMLNQIPTYIETPTWKVEKINIHSFVLPARLKMASFDHFQIFDFESLTGRLLSSSYCPDEKSELFEKVKNDLQNIFDKYQRNGYIHFNYRTMLYFAEVK